MSRIRAWLGAVRRPGTLTAVALGYLLLVSGVMIWRGISVSPDYLLLILVPVAIVSGRFVRFLRHWVPFIALFLGYEALYGVARRSGIPVCERRRRPSHSPTSMMSSSCRGDRSGNRPSRRVRYRRSAGAWVNLPAGGRVSGCSGTAAPGAGVPARHGRERPVWDAVGLAAPRVSRAR